jgi:flagellar biosynthesis protein FlhA
MADAPASSPNMPAWVMTFQKHKGLIVPVSFMGLLVVIIVPISPVLMDLLIIANITISVMMLMTTMYMRNVLEFSAFPSLLLGTTLLRLVLNIASTRLVLTADASSASEVVTVAGGVIAAFGSFVAGSNLIVGVIIFIILIIVQFMVITKGATRISEVAARFTLDAMPGKQMAIDADLAAGIINEAEARKRRDKISREADFFGAMDGASKFVRGDAVAGLIITAINIVGGITIGALVKGWEIGDTFRSFTLLTIGDGISSQIPAFIIAIASALIITGASAQDELGTEMTGQIANNPKGLLITAAFLLLLVFTPLPSLPLLVGAAALIMGAYFLTGGFGKQAKAASKKAQAQAIAAPPRPEPPAPETLLKLDTVEFEVGYSLVQLVDTSRGGDLLDRISAIRRQLAVEMGFILPPVRIRDNLELAPNEYRVKIKGAPVAVGQTFPGKFLAIDSGVTTGPIDGIPSRDPAFGLDAWWIEDAQRGAAEAMNYTVADASSVLTTHLTELVKTHAPELLTRQEVGDLVAQLKTKSPKLVDDTIPGIVKPADLHRILQNLLRERVSIRDLETIVETLGDWCPKTKDTDVLTEYVRNALRRSICQRYSVRDELGRLRLSCATLDPQLEDLINSYIDRSASGTVLTMPPGIAQQVVAKLGLGVQTLLTAGRQPVLLASPQVRATVRQLLENQFPAAVVLGYNEIVPGVEVESLALIGPPESAAAVAA